MEEPLIRGVAPQMRDQASLSNVRRRSRGSLPRLHLSALQIRRWPRNRASFIKIGANVMTVLPRAIRARKSESLRGENHSYRKCDTH
jgi:hypothetical protein